MVIQGPVHKMGMQVQLFKHKSGVISLGAVYPILSLRAVKIVLALQLRVVLNGSSYLRRRLPLIHGLSRRETIFSGGP